MLAVILACAECHRSIHEYVQQDIVHAGATVLGMADASTITQPLDHFNAHTSTWEMRYWSDSSYVKKLGPETPVFLSMGGEGASGPAGGQMAELAEVHQALLVSIEHRFFGKSIPTADFSTNNLQWLGTEQALADAAAFRCYLSTKLGLTNSKWITFGGSYSGELAAWARVKYPALFHAAVASSSPVTASIDFWGYDPIVAAALADSRPEAALGGSTSCYNTVKQAFAAFEDMMHDTSAGGGRSKLQGLFHTCGPVETDGDCYLLHDYVSDDFMGLVQYNSVHSSRNINTTCSFMLSKASGKTPFDRLVALTLSRLDGARETQQQQTHDSNDPQDNNDKNKSDSKNNHRNSSKPRCVYDTDGSTVVDSISFARHLAGYANRSNPGRAWPYMQCADGSGHDQTCDPERGCIFSPRYASLRFFTSLCEAVFNVTAAQTARAVAFNSVNYGDNHTAALGEVSRIAFVNGDIDPFAWGSYTRNTTAGLRSDVLALIVVGGSHCQDMGRSSTLDSPSMRAVKRSKAALVAKWLAL